MKKLLSILPILFAFYCANGQQMPQFSQYVFNYSNINPAALGSQKCLNIKVGYRSQWVGLEGTPKTAFGGFSSRLKFKKSHSTRTWHAIGAYVDSDVMGPMSTTSLTAGYAYHFPVTRDVVASVGVYAGMQQFRVDATKIDVRQTGDPLIQGSGAAFLIPTIIPGIFLSNKNWFAGLNIRSITKNKWDKLLGSGEARNRWHWEFVGGKRIEAGKINIVPSGMLKLVGYSKPALDLGMMFEFSPTFEVGAAWRNTDALAAMVKLRFLKYFTLGYSYDLTTSKLRYGSSNTHEVIIGISACPHNETSFDCPTFN